MKRESQVSDFEERQESHLGGASVLLPGSRNGALFSGESSFGVQRIAGARVPRTRITCKSHYGSYNIPRRLNLSTDFCRLSSWSGQKYGWFDSSGIPLDWWSDVPRLLQYTFRPTDEPLERLTSCETLLEWAITVELLASDEKRVAEREMARHPKISKEQLKAAIDLRATIYRIFSAYASRRKPEPRDVNALNGSADAYAHR
jgi:hypothetical protein